ncbi:MAG: hypothetical protein GEU82_06290 [Luteitalea sp.]|nr:hypothetical protein [Luteitalea sp.]
MLLANIVGSVFLAPGTAVQTEARTWKMRRLLAILIAFPVFLASLRAADLTGVWTLEFELSASQQAYRGECTFKQEGERLTGSCLSGFESLVSVKGGVKGRSATFRFATGIDQGTTVTFSGELNEAETSMNGSVQFVDQNGNKGDGTFTAGRR